MPRLVRRKMVGGSLVYNGDFEYAPPFTAATTMANRYINGSSGGSTTDDSFGWALENNGCAGSFSAQYDQSSLMSGIYSMKLSTTAVSSACNVRPIKNSSTAADKIKYGIPVLQNTSYNVSFRMRTNLVSGSATSGAYLRIGHYSSDGTSITSTDSSKVKTTTGELLYSFIVTTGATTTLFIPELRIIGNDGAATLIMDAYFDLISITPLYPENRTFVEGNLLKNGNCEAVPTFVAPTTTSARYINGTAAGSTVDATCKYAIPSGSVGGGGSANFDSTVSFSGTSSLKLSTNGVGGSVSVTQYLTLSSGIALGNIVRLDPSTSYTLVGYIKTNNTAIGSATISILELNQATSTVVTNTTSSVDGTNEFIKVTLTFTTDPTTLYGALILRNNVTGNTSDAWFDEISLTRTIPPTRAVSGQRMLVRDFGTCLKFVAANATDQVTIPHIPQYTFNKIYSCAFWVKSVGVQSDAEILSKNAGGRYPFTFRHNNSNGRIQFATFDGTFNPGTTGNGQLLPRDGWVHFVGTSNGSQLKFYRNGVLSQTITDTTVSTTDNVSDITVGNRTSSTKWFGGEVDDVIISKDTMTDDNVADLYRRGVLPSNIVLYLKLDEGAGLTAIDSSVYGNSGTITAATYSGNVVRVARTAV